MSVRKDSGIISHKCIHCGKCCQRRGTLSLTPLDVFNISHYLNMSTKDFIDKYCVVRNGFDVYIRTDESDKMCIFLNRDTKGCSSCSIYKVRPMACYLYPLKTRPESKDAFFLDISAACPTSNITQTFLEFVSENSNGRYAEDFTHFRKFCMAIGAYYVDKNGVSESQMFEFLFYNDSEEEVKQKLDKYLFG